MNGPMNGITPGDQVIFRDGDRFAVARVDLVSGGYATAFPFDPARGIWSRKNKRIPAAFILAKVPRGKRAEPLAARIEALHQEREARRQEANIWLREAVGELVTREARCS